MVHPNLQNPLLPLPLPFSLLPPIPLANSLLAPSLPMLPHPCVVLVLFAKYMCLWTNKFLCAPTKIKETIKIKGKIIKIRNKGNKGNWKGKGKGKRKRELSFESKGIESISSQWKQWTQWTEVKGFSCIHQNGPWETLVQVEGICPDHSPRGSSLRGS